LRDAARELELKEAGMGNLVDTAAVAGEFLSSRNSIRMGLLASWMSVIFFRALFVTVSVFNLNTAASCKNT